MIQYKRINKNKIRILEEGKDFIFPKITEVIKRGNTQKYKGIPIEVYREDGSYLEWKNEYLCIEGRSNLYNYMENNDAYYIHSLTCHATLEDRERIIEWLISQGIGKGKARRVSTSLIRKFFFKNQSYESGNFLL